MRLSAAVGVLEPAEVLVRGFEVIAGLPSIGVDDFNAKNIRLFKKFFGPSPTTIAIVWEDIVDEELEADIGVSKADKTEKGFKQFLRALHFLWAYPKNAVILAIATRTSETNVTGQPLWHWVKIVAGLKAKVISWPEEVYNSSTRRFLLTVDGVDFKTYEVSTEEYNVDRQTFSQKHGHGAVKYEIGVDAYEPKIVWIHGPYKAGTHDKTIFEDVGGLLEKIPEGKVVVCDRVYRKSDHADKLALPNLGDSEDLQNFKARLRARHESLNGRLKDWRILFDIYRHPIDNHVHVLEAVAVLVQYQLDNGHPIFDANTEPFE